MILESERIDLGDSVSRQYSIMYRVSKVCAQRRPVGTFMGEEEEEGEILEGIETSMKSVILKPR